MGGTPACRPSPRCSPLLPATGAIRPALMVSVQAGGWAVPGAPHTTTYLPLVTTQIPVKTQDLPLLFSWPKTGPSPTPGQLVAPPTLSCVHPDSWRGCPGPPW